MSDEKREEPAAAASGSEAGATDSSLDLAKKHPLENRWTLWFDTPSKQQRQNANIWGQTLRSVYSFDTVEDFWCLYNNIVPPSRLGAGADFHLFKEGIEPKWEDPRCANGGKWTVLVPKAASGKQLLDTYWLHSILAMIGEQFSESDEICGVVASIRTKQDRVAVWTKTASNEAAQVSIGKELKSILDLPDKQTIGFMAHVSISVLPRPAPVPYA
mmetsp:Transcript_23570/g.56352  ORF Transcript_23570/g.56352 Transcript_23570/m.56352 type:complete len:215 (-) Transcript_23570:97-741(-)